MKKLLLASTSTLFGEKYLDYLLEDLKLFFDGISQITFLPYARPSGISYNDYTKIAAAAFSKINIKVIGLHTFTNPKDGIDQAEAFFCGGGNTFLLVKQLYDLNILESLKLKLEKGTPYLGTSAGSNIAGISMHNTNDMPIVHPPSFKTMALVPFNINAHYLDPDPKSTHNGETRETRIKEFHTVNKTPVIGLREGSYLLINDTNINLKGKHTARIFEANKNTIESTEIDFRFI